MSASTWTNYYVAKYENRKCVYVRVYDVYMDIVWYIYIDICICIYLYIIERERERERERDSHGQDSQTNTHPPLKAGKRKRDRLTHSYRRQQARLVV